MYMLLLMTFLSCHSRTINEKVPVELRKMSKEEIRDDWKHYIYSKGVSDSLCVHGLINRLYEEDCQKIDVQKFRDRVEILCTARDEDRAGFWERYTFHVKPPVLTKTGLNNINIGRAAQYGTICIDQIQKVEAHVTDKPINERIKIKRRD